MWKWILLALVLLVGAGAVYGGMKVKAAYEPADAQDDQMITLTVEKGMTGREVADLLEGHGLVNSGWWFIFVARREGYDRRFQAGEYVLQPSMPATEIMEALTVGRSKWVALTVPEGFTTKQIDERVAALELAGAGEFAEYAESAGPLKHGKANITAKSLEGYLFPDTYFVPVQATIPEIVEMMLDRFDEMIASPHAKDIEEHDMTLHELVTLASVVEREARLASERPMMAQVFLKRMEIGMRLESCATVQYVLPERRDVLTIEDTQFDSPYNTYIHEGLPPGPIGSPGEPCVKAVLDPAETDYLYFRTKGDDGSHTFSRTFSEHEAAGP